ncbi:sirohydrochlorin chelatase [Zafaria sp. Z1313]|uniref:sirohydrochlorin chelatase n=1 Tax=unclassified Zafaria TaxID=2828765 RepID=UPI002E7A985C|nr:CbiX/SirB N-terminal domain-containing protein [Zafaria sp. J156]MEE1621556.1 CbiX/SirB N-terminal domain-containing protein [Zafaria sp. J156]
MSTGLLIPTPPASAPASNAAWSGWEPPVVAGTLVAAAHGTSSPAGRAAVGALVEAVAAARPELSVLPAFVDVQEPDVSTVLRLAGRNPRIVPLLLSAGVHTRRDLAGDAGRFPGATVARALGPDPRIAEVLGQRLEEAGLRRGDHVVLACAGSSDPQGVADCRVMARMLSEHLSRRVEPAFVSAAEPSIASAVERAAERSRRSWFRGGRLVLSSYLLAPGHFAARVAGAGANVVTAPLLAAGRPVPERLVELVLERYTQP